MLSEAKYRGVVGMRTRFFGYEAWFLLFSKDNLRMTNPCLSLRAKRGNLRVGIWFLPLFPCRYLVRHVNIRLVIDIKEGKELRV